MKVLHIGKYFPPYAGGMENYLRDLMTAQARHGLEPGALVHQPTLTLASRHDDYPSDDQTLPVTRAALWGRLLFTPISPTFPLLLRRLLKKQQPDVLHLHLPNVSAFWVLFVPGSRSIPWVLHWHADVVASAHSRGLRLFYSCYRPFERALLKRCRAVIATSPPYLESSLPLREFRDKCHVVPLGLKPPQLARAVPAARKHEGARLLAIGRLTYYKGFEFLIRALARIEGAHLHLVGEGAQEARLRALSRELALDDRISFHGHLSDEELNAQLAACDCLCLPSIERTEAFGMVLLEAMSQGRAVIASAVPGSGMSWVVRDGETGILVPPADTAALSRALQEVTGRPEKIAAMGEAGESRFREHFHIDRSCTAINAVYRNIGLQTGYIGDYRE